MNFIHIPIFDKTLCAWGTEADDSRIAMATKENYEHHITCKLPSILPRGGGFIDVGAHFGFYMTYVKHLKADVPIFNFEPNPRNYACLLQTAGLNGFHSVASYCCGASDMVKTLDYGAGGSNWHNNCSVMDLQGQSEQPVMVLPIDLTPAADTPICCMKIDVEGHEQHVLRGAERLLRSQRPYVIMEYCPQALAQHGTRPLDLIQWMLDRGYKVEVLENQPGMGGVFTDAAECVASVATWPSWIADLLFIPV